jgi:general secretion pathway protein G
MYKLDNQMYPTTDQGLQALVEQPTSTPMPKNWNPAGYIKKGKLPADPWGGPYMYISPGSNGAFDLYSHGADGREGGESYDADIGNW